MVKLVDVLLQRTISPKVQLEFDVIKDENDVILNPEVISKTDQSFAKEADINFIVLRAAKTGFLVDPLIQSRVSRTPLFSDFSDLPTYLELSTRIAQFQSDFDLLPADLRARFGNDPANIINYLADPINDEEAIKLGLKPKPVPAPDSAPAPVPNPVNVPVVPIVPV